MRVFQASLAALALLAATPCFAQFGGPVQVNIGPSDRAISVSAEGQATADAELAILHVGFETKPGDAKSAYVDGARTSNAIVAALKQAGIPEGSIRSERQYLDRDYSNDQQHKFKLVQSWTVKAPADRAAEIVDVAVTAGANSSGQIEWTVNDPKALDAQALEQATARAREDAESLAKGMGVRLGALIYVTKSATPQIMPMVAAHRIASAKAGEAEPLAIEPQKVTRSADVYAVYAIE